MKDTAAMIEDALREIQVLALREQESELSKDLERVIEVLRRETTETSS